MTAISNVKRLLPGVPANTHPKTPLARQSGQRKTGQRSVLPRIKDEKHRRVVPAHGTRLLWLRAFVGIACRAWVHPWMKRAGILCGIMAVACLSGAGCDPAPGAADRGVQLRVRGELFQQTAVVAVRAVRALGLTSRLASPVGLVPQPGGAAIPHSANERQVAARRLLRHFLANSARILISILIFAAIRSSPASELPRMALA